jgi:DNA-binding SARP family transcriptional activator
MRFSVLGPLVVRRGESVVDVTRPKERRLLALLLSRAGQRVAMSEIVDELWPDAAPTSAIRTVQSHVVRLRKLVPEIETSLDGYLLRGDAKSIDACRFEELVGQGRASLRAGDAEAAAIALADAERLWRGPAYEEIASTGIGFAAVEGSRLDRLRVAALEDRWDAGLRVGEHREAVAALERMVADEPLRERLWGLLMLALYRSDRQADALATYRRAARTLATELGIDPSPTLRQLHADILAQDAGLRGSADADPTLLLAHTMQILAGADSGSGAVGPCPWLGLRSYGAADQAMYVGRERMVADLVARLAAPGVVTVLGSSGIGKSSLVRAGVVPALSSWRSVVLTPGDHPTAVIEDAAAAVPDGGDEPVLVVIDQAEELFAAADLPVDRLLALCDAPAIRLVLVVRADMAPVLAAEPRIAERLRDTVFMVGPMTPAELTRVVVVPAARSGRHVEPALLGQILTDLQGREAMLPLLATALEATWRAEEGGVLTLETYLEVGGIGASLERSAEELLNHLDAPGREAVRRILLRLADSSVGQPVIRRRAPLAEVAPPDDAVATQAFARLVERRLVSASASGSRSPTRSCSRRGHACAGGSMRMSMAVTSCASWRRPRRSGPRPGTSPASIAGPGCRSRSTGRRRTRAS